MMRTMIIFAAVAAGIAAPAYSQPAPPPVAMTPQALFAARSGSDAVYFGPGGALLDQQARLTLTAQATYLTSNPLLRARIEGHSEERGTREHSLAIAERRAAAVRNYLVSLGVEPARLTVVSWGKERPARVGIGPAVDALNRRVVTVIAP